MSTAAYSIHKQGFAHTDLYTSKRRIETYSRRGQIGHALKKGAASLHGKGMLIFSFYNCDNAVFIANESPTKVHDFLSSLGIV